MFGVGESLHSAQVVHLVHKHCTVPPRACSQSAVVYCHTMTDAPQPQRYELAAGGGPYLVKPRRMYQVGILFGLSTVSGAIWALYNP